MRRLVVTIKATFGAELLLALTNSSTVESATRFVTYLEEYQLIGQNHLQVEYLTCSGELINNFSFGWPDLTFWHYSWKIQDCDLSTCFLTFEPPKLPLDSFQVGSIQMFISFLGQFRSELCCFLRFSLSSTLLKLFESAFLLSIPLRFLLE